MAAVMVADIVASTRLTQSLGTAAFQEKQRALDEGAIEICSARHGTVPSDVNSGDGVTALFDRTGPAVAAAQELMLAAESIGLQLRAAVHRCAGPPERRDLADAERICGHAAPGEIVVSAPVLVDVDGLTPWVDLAGRAELTSGTASLYRIRTIVPTGILDEEPAD